MREGWVAGKELVLAMPRGTKEQPTGIMAAGSAGHSLHCAGQAACCWHLGFKQLSRWVLSQSLYCKRVKKGTDMLHGSPKVTQSPKVS